jgi:prevent-host-death family protein
MPRTMTLSEARESFSELVNRVKYTGDRVIISKHGKQAAAVISPEDLALFEALIERYENEIDLEEVKRILSEEKREDFIAWETVKAENGLRS